MGRHSLPDGYGAGSADPRLRARRRNVALAAVLVLTVAAGTAAAVGGGLFSFGSSCQDDAVRLRVAASPDIAPALKAAAEHARASHVTSDGHCLDIAVTAREAHEVADTLRSGRGAGVQVWVPDSDLWVQRVTGADRATGVTRAGAVASSPVGVAMVPSAARSLGWPDRTYTWTELAGAGLRGDGPGLGAADPARSATGLLALTRLSATASGGKGGDTGVAALVKGLSRRTADGDGQVLATLSGGTGRGEANPNQALVLSEQAAFAHNSAVEDGAGLDLFYPEDGSPRLDYPFTLVDEARLTTDESRAALRFMTFMGQPEGRRILLRHGFRPEADTAPAALVTAAGGRFPQPYAESAPEPASARALQKALGMWTVTVQSARVTAVVDTSASMTERVPGTTRSRMDVTKASLSQALATFTAEDEVGLWTFAAKLDGNRDYRVVVPTKRLGDRVGHGTQRGALAKAFSGLRPVPGGATGLYDTTLAAYRAATGSYARGKFNALVVLTDGVNQDPGSISRSRLVEELEKLADPDRPVPLIAIAVGPEADEEEAERIAAATGGSAHKVSEPSRIHSVILEAIVAAGSRS
ncbi:substrate-binding and VWA domain-containing protein [Streptomyces sp. NPDC004082]